MRRLRTRQTIGWMAAAAVCAAAALVTARADDPYALTGHARLGFYATSTAFDAPNRRLYASSRDGVYEIDTASAKVLGRIGNVRGAGSIALSREHRELYVLSLHGDALRVIDIAGRKVVRTFDAPAWFNVFYEASSGELYYLRGDSRDVRIVDRTTGRTIKTVTLDGHPASVVCDPARRRVLVRLVDRDLIQVIDAAERAISVSWPLSADGPSSMAVDDTGSRVFASAGRTVKMLDGLTGKEMGRFATGDQVRSIVFDPATELVAALWGRSGINVARVAPLGLELVQSLDTRAVVRQLMLDPTTHTLFAMGTIGDQDVMGINANDTPSAAIRTSSLLTLRYRK